MENETKSDHDVSARLDESEARYRAFIDNASDMIQSVRADGTFEFVNRAWLHQLGYEKVDVPGLIIWDIIHPDSRAHCEAFFALVMQGQTLNHVDAIFKTRDGTAIPVEGDATPRILDGSVVATHSFFRDVRDRLRAHELEEKNARLELAERARYQEKMAALGKLSAGLSHELNNPAAAAQRASDQLAESLNRRDAATRALIDAGLSAEGWDDLSNLLKRARAGVEQAGDPDPLAVSEREAAVEEWLEEQQVERAWEVAPQLVTIGVDAAALEELGAGLPPQAMNAAIEWLGQSVTVLDLTDVVTRSADRISQLVGAVKSYSHMDRATEQVVDVHDGIEDTLKILGHRLKDVTVRREYDRSLPSVHTLGNSLNQVWTNILDNAIDATDGRGTVTIRTRRDGKAIAVELADDGAGITPEDLNCIFEPFFTTKPQGQGTGLGLDTVWRIVTEEHQGTIEVESKPGNTVFRVRLPVAGAD
jgi:PAS domain S-box-containing protein